MSDFDQIKNILHGFNLEDDYFINPDATENTGEIKSNPTDANILLKAGASIKPQLTKMRSAVDKIYKGYLAAYDKESYKKKFDIYPLRDFENYMADLGATRASNGKDFEPTGEKIDWVKLVKKEIKTRLADYNKNEEKRKAEKEQEKVDEEATKISENLTKTDNNNVKNDATNIKESLKKDLGISVPKELTDLDIVNLYKAVKDGKTYPYTEVYINKLPKGSLQKLTDYFTSHPIALKSDETDINSESEFRDKNRERLSQLKVGTSSYVKQYKDDLKKKKERLATLDDANAKEIEILNKEIIDLEKQIKKAEDQRSSLYKGIIQTEQEHDSFVDTLKTSYERKISKYDGFTTQGPFCLEKRKYFLEVYRPSIEHINTEFREPLTKTKPAKDEGNNILAITHKKGTLDVSGDNETVASKIVDNFKNPGIKNSNTKKLLDASNPGLNPPRAEKLERIVNSLMTVWEYVIFNKQALDPDSAIIWSWQDFLTLKDKLNKTAFGNVTNGPIYSFTTTPSGWDALKGVIHGGILKKNDTVIKLTIKICEDINKLRIIPSVKIITEFLKAVEFF